MNGSDDIVADTASRILADLGDPRTLNRARDDGWRAPLWNALADAGLTLAWVGEDLGGAGASTADGFSILRIAGQYAVPVPLAETLLAGWLLAQGAIVSPTGAMTVAPVRPRDRIQFGQDGLLRGRAGGIPFAREARHLAVIADGEGGSVVALVGVDDLRIEQGRSLARDPLDSVVLDGIAPHAVAPLPFDARTLMLMGALARSVMTAGALSTVLDMSVTYANERVAFERPIAKFQAVQHNLARLAGEVAAATAAAASAADAVARLEDIGDLTSDDAIFLEIAAARIRCAEAAAEGAAIAHQVFGALGFTQEHVLHRFTLRMLAWRDEFGHESQWAVELGNRIAARGADEFWPLVASR